MSDNFDSHGIGAARRYLYRELRAYSRDCSGCLRVEYDPAMIVNARHPQRVTMNVVNVLAWLPGRDTTRVVVMGGHYDSCVCKTNTNDSTSTAPGADDDGLEAPRSRVGPCDVEAISEGLDATIVFALYAAEEQGTLGSAHLAQRLKDAGLDDRRGDDGRHRRQCDRGERQEGLDERAHLCRRFGAEPEWRTRAICVGTRRGLPAEIQCGRRSASTASGARRPRTVPARWRRLALRFTERLENYKTSAPADGRIQLCEFRYKHRQASTLRRLRPLAAAPPPPDSARQVRDTLSGGQDWDSNGSCARRGFVRSAGAPDGAANVCAGDSRAGHVVPARRRTRRCRCGGALR